MKPHDDAEKFATICARWMSRRDAIRGMAAAGVSIATFGSLSAACSDSGRLSTADFTAPPLSFTEIPHRLDETHHVAPGYEARVLISWGDPVVANAPEFDSGRQNAVAQDRQFGYNNDFIAYFPLSGPAESPLVQSPAAEDSRGLLCVNHEYTTAYLMFPGYSGWSDSAAGLSREQVDVEIAAHGLSVVEIEKIDNRWRRAGNSRFNRRITMRTPMHISGPAAGHERLKTGADPGGGKIVGTMGNCAGGVTPWGTVLSAEENFRYNFGGYPAELHETHPREARNYARFHFGGHERRQWYRYYDRFHIAREPHEGNRFGWMVEFDPYDPHSRPVKRSCLGRFQHEGCSVVADEGNPLVAYTGDDGINEYVYKFVSRERYRAEAGKANSELFDDGTLYVARFHDDGSGEWLPLVFGRGPLTAANGFHDQGDVVIDARIAADMVGATPMDRPEDIDTDPVTGRSYVMLTKNPDRASSDAPNPRSPNHWGQVVEILAPGNDGARDHSATRFEWDIFILAGDPDKNGEARGAYGQGTTNNGWFCNPDNIAFDPFGRIWMATDNGSDFGFHDGLWAAQTTGSARAVSRHFFGCPRGAELCGPCFTPDGKTLFVSVQHPADEDGSSCLEPSTRWPDFDDGIPPRPSIVAITRSDRKTIGS